MELLWQVAHCANDVTMESCVGYEPDLPYQLAEANDYAVSYWHYHHLLYYNIFLSFNHIK